MTLKPEFRFLEVGLFLFILVRAIGMTVYCNYCLQVAYPYIAKRLLTDRDARLRERLIQVLFKQGKFQWERLENLVELAQEGAGELDLTDTVSDGAQLLITDEQLRTQLILALTEDDRLHVDEVARLLAVLQGGVKVDKLAQTATTDGPEFLRKMALSWSESVLRA